MGSCHSQTQPVVKTCLRGKRVVTVSTLILGTEHLSYGSLVTMETHLTSCQGQTGRKIPILM